jgi:peptidyl-tRNA hydrolase, PTH2 family
MFYFFIVGFKRFINSITAFGRMEDLQMVIVARKDLKLPKGKLAVQAAHASVSLAMKAKDTKNYKEWFNSGQKKILVFCENEKELLALMQKSKDNGLLTSLVQDAGRTVVEPGTKTCIAIGPAPESSFKGLTDTLHLV